MGAEEKCLPEPPYIRLDLDARAAYMALSSADVDLTEEVAPGIIADFGVDDDVVGIEFLDDRVIEIFEHIAEQSIMVSPGEEKLTLLRALFSDAIEEYKEAREEVSDPDFLKHYIAPFICTNTPWSTWLKMVEVLADE